ncbi:transcriptional regulator [Oryzobacter telluris]|uniref:transcriptional regulator n=1 Tax=Oryzobacter telluris TaxID=3149179 RepID=UPI00370D4DC7
MPYPVFDEVIHEPHRLRICALLVPSAGTEFGAVRDEMGLSDSALSKHLKALTTRGYTRLDRAVREGRQVTTVVLTPAGREALCGHVAELQRMARIVGTDRRTSGLRPH